MDGRTVKEVDGADGAWDGRATLGTEGARVGQLGWRASGLGWTRGMDERTLP